MIDQSTRINALIAYLFLGPIMLLARQGTPFGEAFVRSHARRASLIMLIGILVLLGYFFLRPYIAFSILGFSLSTIILTIIMSILLLVLGMGAYRAFHGVEAGSVSTRSFLSLPQTEFRVGEHREEDKIRILASFFPFIGIITAAQFPSEETLLGRKVGNFFTFLLITSIVWIAGQNSTLTFVITLIYIALVVVTAVYLFGSGKLLKMGWYSLIPTYDQIDASIRAAIRSSIDFFRVAFGGNDPVSYKGLYDLYLAENQRVQAPTIDLVPPAWMTGIPLLNLVFVGSLSKKEYRNIIWQGFFLTVLCILVVIWKGSDSRMMLYLLFPVITLIISTHRDTNIQAPITSIITHITRWWGHTQEKVNTLKKEEQTVSFKYK